MKSERHSHSHHCGAAAPRDSFAGDFNFEAYVEDLTARNRLAADLGFRFHVVSGTDGLLDAMESLMDSSAFVAVSDDALTSGEASSTPSLVRQKLIIFVMRHAVGDDRARAKCLHTLRELARQFLARMLNDRWILAADRGVMFEEEFQITEPDKYFFSGAACLILNVAYHFKTSLIYDADLWNE